MWILWEGSFYAGDYTPAHIRLRYCFLRSGESLGSVGRKPLTAGGKEIPHTLNGGVATFTLDLVADERPVRLLWLVPKGESV